MTEQYLINQQEELINSYEEEIENYNIKFINSLGRNAMKRFKEMTDCCIILDKIKYVDKPKGDIQNENFGVFKDIRVYQWCTNMEGDSFSGYIYANVKGNWIEVGYSC